MPDDSALPETQGEGQQPTPIIIDNRCHRVVNVDPMEAISAQFDYNKGPDGNLIQTQIDDNDRRQLPRGEDLRWYSDMME